MLRRLLCIVLMWSLAGCFGSDKAMRNQFAAANRALAVHDTYAAATYLAPVLNASSNPKLQAQTKEILSGDSFGAEFLEAYIRRVPGMDAKTFADNTDLLFTMLRVNPALQRQGDAVWDTLCARLQPDEGFPVTARVGELLPCSKDAAYAERIYLNSVEYLRPGIDQAEFSALVRFTKNPARAAYASRLQKDLVRFELDSDVLQNPTFREAAGGQAEAIVQVSIPGYALHFPQGTAALERAVRARLARRTDIREGQRNTPNTAFIKINALALDEDFYKQNEGRRAIPYGDCWPSVQKRMGIGNVFTFTVRETVKESLLSGTATVSLNGAPSQTVPLRFTVKEESIACTDYRIEQGRGGRPNLSAYDRLYGYANGEMAAMCSRNRDYMTTKAVIQQMADYLADTLGDTIRALKR